MLPELMNFDSKDKDSVDRWAFNNADDHTFVRGVAQTKGFGNLIQYVLYPLSPGNLNSWALRHQTAHNEVNQALGLAGTDLTGVDFNDEKQAAEWNLSHYREHEAWHAALGI